MEAITEIEFKRTGHFLLDNGIVALDYYLERFRREAESEISYHFELEPQRLTLSCETQQDLFQILEEVYYFMGKEVYDTPTEFKESEYSNAYYDEEEKKFVRFPKMNTYGLGNLLTNNAAGKTKIDQNTRRKKELKKEQPEVVHLFEQYFENQGIKLQQQLYFNEPYVKTTRFDLKEKHLRPGSKKCYLTGEGFRELVSTKNTSPFFLISSFNSFTKENDKPISWKAMYISRFAPQRSLYQYHKGMNLSVFLYDSGSLTQLREISRINAKVVLPRESQIAKKYLTNINLEEFQIDKTGLVGLKDTLFGLIYAFYRVLLRSQLEEREMQKDELDDIFDELSIEHQPIAIAYLHAKKYASTMRPDEFEYLDDFKFQVRLMHHLEKNGVEIIPLMHGLVLKKRATDDYATERLFRSHVISAILAGQSLLDYWEDLFETAFGQLLSSGSRGRQYASLMKMLTLYEPIIYFGGNKAMTPELQQRALNLGKSIGQSILNDDPNESKQSNAKAGRSYIIALRKARTMDQFLDEVTRVQFRFNVSVANDILTEINEKNWKPIKQFAVISALNQLNSAIQPRKSASSNANQ